MRPMSDIPHYDVSTFRCSVCGHMDGYNKQGIRGVPDCKVCGAPMAECTGDDRTKVLKRMGVPME
jgi:transcription elongation factor Elf1